MPVTNLSQPIQNPVIQSHSYTTYSQFPASNQLNLSGSVNSVPFNNVSALPSSSSPSVYNNAPQFIVQNSNPSTCSSTNVEVPNQPNRTIQSSCNGPTSSSHQQFQHSPVRQLSQFVDNVGTGPNQSEFNYRQGNDSLHNQGLTSQDSLTIRNETITFSQRNSEVQFLNNYNSQRPDQRNSVLQSSNHAADIPNSDLTVSSTDSPLSSSVLTATEVTVLDGAISNTTSVDTVANETAYIPLRHSNEDRTAPVVHKQTIVTAEDIALPPSNSKVDLFRPGEASEPVSEKVVTKNASENDATYTVTENSKEVRLASEKRLSESENIGSSNQLLQEDITVSSSETGPLEESVETVLERPVTHSPSGSSPQRSPDTSTQLFPFENASVAKRKLPSPSTSNHEVVVNENQRTSDDVPTSSGLGDDSLQSDPVAPPSDDEVIIFAEVDNVETDDSVKEKEETAEPQNESHENVLDNDTATNLPADNDSTKKSTEHSENAVQSVEKVRESLAGRDLVSPVIIDCDEISCVICAKSIGELVCCSSCSRLYHEQCYVHPLPAPGFEESWKCLMCMDVHHCPLPPRYGRKRKYIYMNGRDVLKCQRLLLELYMCSASIFNGQSKGIVDLTVIKKRITDLFFIPYEEPAEFIEDIKILLQTSQRNCKIGSRESLAVQNLRAALNDLISRYYPSLLAGISLFHTAENIFSPSRKKRKVMC